MTDEEYCSKINKLYTDMYIGSGKNDPSITTRLSMMESTSAQMKTQLTDLDISLNGDNENPGLKSEFKEVLTYIKSSLQWIKGIGWFLIFACTVIGLYIASLEYRHKISESDTPVKSSMNQKLNTKLTSVN